MNDWQAVQQLKHIIAAIKWGGSGDYLFNKVVISHMDAKQVGQTVRPPIASILIGDANTDEENPSLLNHRFPVHILNAVEGDSFSEKAVLGAHRISATSSRNRGLLEIQAELLSNVRRLLQESGITLIGYHMSELPAEFIDGVWLLQRVIQFELVLSDYKDYPKGRKLQATTPGGGVCNLTWVNPSERFDLNTTVPRGTMVLRRASGATPPASATAGTGVTLASNMATSVSDNPGAGTFSYALFAGYDETGDGTVDEYSESVTKLSVAVT